MLRWRDSPVCPARQEAFGAGGTPQSCPWLEMSILSLQSFFEGWDASKKKDKTKGRQDHVSTCECLLQRLRHPKQLQNPRILHSADSWARAIAWDALVGDQALTVPCPLSPDDRHRVKLHPLLGDPNSDYINANYIDVSGDRAGVLGVLGCNRSFLWTLRVCPAAFGGVWTAQSGLDNTSLEHIMKDLPDLFVFISSFCSLHLSLLCSALSLLSHSLSAFLSLFPLTCSCGSGSPSPWVGHAEVERTKGQSGAHTRVPLNPASVCESGQSPALVSSESSVPRSDVPCHLQCC